MSGPSVPKRPPVDHSVVLDGVVYVERGALERDLATARRVNRRLLDEGRQEHERVKAERDSWSKRAIAAEAKLESVAVAHYFEKAERLDSEVLSMRRSLRDARQALAASVPRDERERVKRHLDAARRLYTHAGRERDEAQAGLGKLQAYNDALKREVDGLKRERDEAKAKMGRLEVGSTILVEENKRLKGLLDSAEDRLNMWRERAVGLRYMPVDHIADTKHGDEALWELVLKQVRVGDDGLGMHRREIKGLKQTCDRLVAELDEWHLWSDGLASFDQRHWGGTDYLTSAKAIVERMQEERVTAVPRDEYTRVVMLLADWRKRALDLLGCRDFESYGSDDGSVWRHLLYTLADDSALPVRAVIALAMGVPVDPSLTLMLGRFEEASKGVDKVHAAGVEEGRRLMVEETAAALGAARGEAPEAAHTAESFEAETGATPDQWLVGWHARAIPNTHKNFRLFLRAEVLIREDAVT